MKWILLLAMFTTAPLYAADVEQHWKIDQGTSAGLSDHLKRLAALPGFQCTFEQQMLFSDGGGQRFSGEVAVRKPSRFRWHYALPYEQLYVGNGKVIWHYEPDLMQAERLTDLEQVDPAVMRLLDGRVGIDEVELLESATDQTLKLNRYRVRIGNSPEVWLGFNGDGDLVQIERTDLLGNSNRMQLKACAYVAPAENLFSFTPPEGVDVVDLRGIGQ